MRPIRIYLENFMCHASTDIDCTQFNSALIVAKNKLNESVSNGAGKTTIYLAIEYALFNKVPTTLDEIVRDGCDKAIVTFEFETSDGNIYSVTRTRSNLSNKSDIKLMQKNSDGWVPIPARTIPDAEAELFKIIKITHKAFINSILFAQHDMSGLATASPDKRRDILKEPLQLIIYSKLEKIEKERRSKTAAELEKINGIISMIGTPDIDIQLSEVELKSTEQKIIEKENEIFELRTSITNKRLELSEAERVVLSSSSDSNEKLNEIRNKKRLLENNISQLKTQIIQSKKKIDELVQDRDTKTSSFRNLEEKLKNIKSNKLRNVELITSDFDKMTARELEGIKLIASLEQQLRTINTPYPEGDVCSNCLQIISVEHRTSCKQKSLLKSKEISEQLVKNKETLIKVQKKKREFELELKATISNQNQIDNIEKDILSKHDIIASDAKLIATYNELRVKKEEELKKLDADLLFISSEEISLINISKNNSINDLKRKIIILKNEIDILDKQIFVANKTSSEAMGRKGALLEKIKLRKDALSTLNSLKETCKNLEKKIIIQNNVLKAFGSKGIPTLIINTILDDLQVEANNLLADFRPGLQLQLLTEKEKDGKQEETLDIIYSVHGKERPWQLISGGQRFFFSFCLKLGLSRVIQNRLGVDIKFLEFDETDRYLDDAGVDSLAEAIKKLHDKYKIFLITHNKSLKDKFTHAILVNGDEFNGAHASVVTSW